MTGYTATELALMLLGYTAAGDDDPQQTDTWQRMALPALQTVLADILHVLRSEAALPQTLGETLPVTDDAAHRAVVPGLAMLLAQASGDGDGYNRFALVYAQRRSSLPKAARRVEDTAPLPTT